ncbi:hypothetical protein MKK68_10020 [Methylobacterium sp. E-016]|uniref:hypothetical protein n=1 Tax=Methylobacterium sp. E-016 TaxID=2836556 RepID=UPI001FBA1D71|nr:hypothetical protein [Methylobacterium sp. E-016]MCJ2075990.1 hypothetical protein [Methylobacterium sp. E-016]
MIAIPGRTVVQKVSVVICVVAYAFGILMFAVIASDQFSDQRLLSTGSKVEGTIVTVSPRKNHTWGTIDYRLPNGAYCHDWTELAPNGVVHIGEPLTVAVEQICGHPVSSKKQLTPWISLCLCVGGALHLMYVAWRASRTKDAA